jgi:hypothetical protein
VSAAAGDGGGGSAAQVGLGSVVNGTAFTSDQGITYNMAAHMGVELSAVL